LRQFILFGLVGTVGFIVDAAVLLYLVHLKNFDLIHSRIISFVIAVFCTWILNRYFTFSNKKQNHKLKEYSRYFTVQVIGALINFIVFFSLIYIYPPLKEMLIIPLAAASIIAMFFNYLASKKKVFI
jgi:putative flippase GtrA